MKARTEVVKFKANLEKRNGYAAPALGFPKFRKQQCMAKERRSVPGYPLPDPNDRRSTMSEGLLPRCILFGQLEEPPADCRCGALGRSPRRAEATKEPLALYPNSRLAKPPAVSTQNRTISIYNTYPLLHLLRL